MVTGKPGSDGADRTGMGMNVEHRQHRGLNNRAENAHLPPRPRERIMKRFKSARHLQRFVSIHDPVARLHNFPRHAMSSSSERALRSGAMGVAAWRALTIPQERCREFALGFFLESVASQFLANVALADGCPRHAS
jgi:putative transposase